MARSRSGRAVGPVVTPLEHQVPVEWAVVGTPAWLDTEWASDALEGIETWPIEDPETDLAPILEYLWTLKILGVDTETAGPYDPKDKRGSMNPQNPGTRMVLLQIGDEAKVFLVEPALMPHFQALLESDQVLHVGHNLIYDFKWLLVKYGVHVQRMYCSMLAEQILTAGLMGMRVSLADSVRRREPYWIINKAVRDAFVHLDHHKGCSDCTPAPHKPLTRAMGYYAARDIVLLFPLMREQLRELKHYELTRTAQIEFDIIPATAEMEIGGVDLYLPIMRQIIEYWSGEEEDLAAEFFTLYAEERKEIGKVAEDSLFGDVASAINLKSNAAKLAVLRELNVDLDDIQRGTLKSVVTKGIVEKKVGRKTVEVEIDLTPRMRRMLEILMAFSEATKYTTTYGKNMVGKISPVTGRWHPRFKQLGSGEEEGRKSGGDDKSTIATGRFSSDAQQFPKPKERFGRVRNPKEEALVLKHFAAEIAAAKDKYVQAQSAPAA